MSIPILWVSLVHAADPVPAASTKGKSKIVVSGFEGFAGRTVNASAEFGRAIAARFPDLDITFVEVPCVWGVPQEVIRDKMKLDPALWIAFGEGGQNFRIETVANNERLPLPDNRGAAPSASTIDEHGPARLELGGTPADLRERMVKLGYPCSVSDRAGRYLCEEMLYGLLQEMRRPGTPLQGAIFVHVPIHGKAITVRGQTVAFSGDTLNTAAAEMFPEILSWLNARAVSSPAGKSKATPTAR